MAWEVGHPLRRDGTSQRLLDLLRPENVPIDNRLPQDLMLFLSKLAPEFVYYNFQNQPDGDWQDFFKSLENEADMSQAEAGQLRARHFCDVPPQ